MLLEWMDVTSQDFEGLQDAVCVLCAGSCEQHAAYLPVGTDSFLCESVAREAAKKADCRVLLLPSLCYGYSPHHRAFAGCITLRQQTIAAMVKEICACVYANGFEKILIVNAHGGNQTCLQAAVNELGEESGVYPVLARYWDLAAEEIESLRQSGPGGMGHACELETSLMLHYAPGLVKKERIEALPPAKCGRWHSPDLLACNKVYIYKPFEQYSPRGTIGQPQYASAQKGAKLAQAITDNLARLMAHVSAHSL